MGPGFDYRLVQSLLGPNLDVVQSREWKLSLQQTPQDPGDVFLDLLNCYW